MEDSPADKFRQTREKLQVFCQAKSQPTDRRITVLPKFENGEMGRERQKRHPKASLCYGVWVDKNDNVNDHEKKQKTPILTQNKFI